MAAGRLLLLLLLSCGILSALATSRPPNILFVIIGKPPPHPLSCTGPSDVLRGRCPGRLAKAPFRPKSVYTVSSDDAGVDDVGFSAVPPSPIRGKTPHLDRLAAEAVRLKEYYTHPVW